MKNLYGVFCNSCEQLNECCDPTRFYFAFVLNELTDLREKTDYFFNPGNFADKAAGNVKGLPAIDEHSFQIELLAAFHSVSYCLCSLVPCCFHI